MMTETNLQNSTLNSGIIQTEKSLANLSAEGFSQVKRTKSIAREVTLNGLLIALVFVSTYLIQIRLPISLNGGLIHMGNVALFSTALLLGKRRGAIAGAFGMGIFDLVSGWVVWAPFTFVVRGVMGYLIGRLSEGEKPLWWQTPLAILVGGIWMIGGYYVTEALLYGNWLAPVTSIPGNLTQIVLGTVIALPLSRALRPIRERYRD
jgi:uncharacterized membrane protein